MSSEAIQWTIHGDAHFKCSNQPLSFIKLNETTNKLGLILQNESVYKVQHLANIWTVDGLACIIHCAGCMQAPHPKADWLETTTPPPPPTTRNNKNHEACLLLFWLFFPSNWGRGEIGGGRRKRGKGGVSIEKNITHGLGWGFTQDSSPVYAAEHERGITSVDRRAGQRAGWLFLRQWAWWRDGNRHSA